MTSVLLTWSERDRHFRNGETKLGDRLQPGVLAFHLESTVGVYTYHMWLAFYEEWKAGEGKSTGYEAERGSPVKISQALCSRIISSVLEEHRNLCGSSKPWSVARDMIRKYGLFERDQWALKIKKHLQADLDTPASPTTGTPSQGTNGSRVPETPQGSVVDLTSSDLDDFWSQPPSPKQAPIWVEPNTRNLRQTKVITYYPKAPFPMHRSWGLMSLSIPITPIVPTTPTSSPSIVGSKQTKSKQTLRVKTTGDKPHLEPKEVSSTIGGLPLHEIVGIFERSRSDIMAERMSLKMMAESLARRSAGTDEAYWKGIWDEWVLKIGVFGHAI